MSNAHKFLAPEQIVLPLSLSLLAPILSLSLSWQQTIYIYIYRERERWKIKKKSYEEVEKYLHIFFAKVRLYFFYKLCFFRSKNGI
jgi:hypothetical protein